MKLASEAEVKCEGSITVCGYRGVIYSLKTEVLAMRAVCMTRGNDADICTHVNEETSTKDLSVMKNRRLEEWPTTPVAASVWPVLLTSHMLAYTFWQHHHTSGDTNRVSGIQERWDEVNRSEKEKEVWADNLVRKDS